MKASSRLLLLRPSTTFRSRIRQPPSNPSNPSRPFVSDALTPLQTLTANRILPYRSAPLYNLIADIAAYPSFIPYCTSSAITSLSAPDPTYQKQWPRTADLRIGYGPYDELFRSAVYCLPHTVLEAVAGDAAPTIPRSKLPHYFANHDDRSVEHDADNDKSSGNRSIFTSLLTRWTFKEFPFKPAPPAGQTPQEGTASAPSSPRTEVGLVVEVRFASAVYSALSQAAAPKVAGLMIGAFERRVGAVLGTGHGIESRAEKDAEERSALEGVRRGENRFVA